MRGRSGPLHRMRGNALNYRNRDRDPDCRRRSRDSRMALDRWWRGTVVHLVSGLVCGDAFGLLSYGPIESAASAGSEWDGTGMRSTEIVAAFWEDVWNAHDPDAVDRLVADD